MKVKLNLMIRNPDEFLKGDYGNCFSLLQGDLVDVMTKSDFHYIDCGKIELDVTISGETVTAHVLKTLDDEIERENAEHSVKLDLLQTRKDELLAITHQPNIASVTTAKGVA